MTPAIAVKGLNHWFGVGEARKQALFDVSIDIFPGELTILLGASGSGKTTLLTLMGCLRRVQEGSVTLLGKELLGASEAALVGHRQKIGFIFQAHNLHESLTARQNVRMGIDVHQGVPEATADAAALHLLGMLGLSDRTDYLPGNLSGGQKQRVAVARALAGNPQVIFADEPTAALDRDSALNVVNLLKRLGRARGATISWSRMTPR